jgi:hypothetical protein
LRVNGKDLAATPFRQLPLDLFDQSHLFCVEPVLRKIARVSD